LEKRERKEEKREKKREMKLKKKKLTLSFSSLFLLNSSLHSTPLHQKQNQARGLTIDKARGNILKIDRHKYVKLAYHGFSELSREERLSTYARTSEAFDYDEPDFALIDTLFSLAEAHLFMQLVELAEAAPEALPPGKVLFRDLYRDVRAAVDLCHRDGSLKSAVASNPGEYIHEDKKLAPLLR